MRTLKCKCRRCGREYEYDEGGDRGYDRELCGPFCHGYEAGRRDHDGLVDAYHALYAEAMALAPREHRVRIADMATAALAAASPAPATSTDTPAHG